MLPILFRIGPVTIYSFGLALALAVLVGTFLVWRQSRRMGLSEEKVLDIWFLTIMLSFIFGRIGYVYLNWSIFSVDWSRILLIVKYPGLSFVTSLLAGLTVSGLLARNAGLSAFLIWDTFSLAMSFSLIFGLFGCFLDNCIAGAPVYTSLILSGVGFVWWLGLNFLARTLTRSPALAAIAKKPGLLLLGYLIFQVISFLMLRSTVSNQQTVIYGALLAGLLIFFVGRYWLLFKHLYDSVSQKRSITNI